MDGSLHKAMHITIYYTILFTLKVPSTYLLRAYASTSSWWCVETTMCRLPSTMISFVVPSSWNSGGMCSYCISNSRYVGLRGHVLCLYAFATQPRFNAVGRSGRLVTSTTMHVTISTTYYIKISGRTVSGL